MAENTVDTYTLQKCYDYIDTQTDGFHGENLPKIFKFTGVNTPYSDIAYYGDNIPKTGDIGIITPNYNVGFFWLCIYADSQNVYWMPLQEKFIAGNSLTFNRDEYNNLILDLEVNPLLRVEQTLPLEGVANTLYLIPKQDGSQGDIYDEYVWVEGAWEKIGSLGIDLSNYYTKEQVDIITGERKGQLELENEISTPFSTIGVSSFKITGSTPSIYPGPNTFKYATQQEGPWNFFTINTELDVSNYNTIYLKYTKEESSPVNILNVNLSYTLSNHFVRKTELDGFNYASKSYVSTELNSLYSQVENQINGISNRLSSLTTQIGNATHDISDLQTAVSNKQDRLTAGNNIEINRQGVISVVGITPTSTAPQFEKITEVEIQSSTTTPLTWTDTNEETEYDDIFIVCRSFKGSGNLKVDIATTKDKSSTGKFTIFNQTNALTSGGSAIFIENERLTEDTFKCDYKIGITPNVTGVQGKNYVVGNSSPTISNKIYSVEVSAPSGVTSGTIELYGKKKF